MGGGGGVDMVTGASVRTLGVHVEGPAGKLSDCVRILCIAERRR